MSNLVLTLNSGGVPIRWSTWQDAVVAHCKDSILWSLGDQTVYHGGKSRMTGEISTVSVPSIIAIKGLSKVKYRTPPLTNRNLFGRDLHICGYCGEKFSHDHLTRDHIVPVSKGGKNIWSNVITACKDCNGEKDDLLLEDWGKQLLYVPYTPDRCEYLILANRRILTDQMEFLAANLPKHSRMRQLM